MWYKVALKKAEDKIKKGKNTLCGIDIFIEYLKGETRTKTNSEGKTWSRKMTAAYGRISKTEGNDGDCVDVFVGEDLDSDKIYIVDQLNKDGEFDEHKVVGGVASKGKAKELYLSNYPKGWECGEITEMDAKKFRQWLSSAPKNIPASEW